MRERPKLDLSAKKRALLQALLRKEGVAHTDAGTIQRRASDEPAPLSFAQERVWFLDQVAGDSPVFNVPGAVPLRGPLDVDAVRRGLIEIARRHDVLRTTLEAAAERPVQVVATADGIDVELPIVDLGDIDAADREAELIERLRAETRRTFDITVGPLWRTTLFRLAPEEHVLLVVMHHSISEAASIAVLFEELAALYGASLEGRPSPLEELPIQYADYAEWQRRRVEEEIVGKQLAYWKEQLGGDLPTLQLPLDRPRPASQTFNGAFASAPLPGTVTDPLKELAREEGATPFMLFLAAWVVLLSRYGGQDDIVVGSPLARRDRAELSGLIGFFVNTIVLRTDVSDSPTFRTLLGRVRGNALEAFDHGDLPFELVVEELRPARDQSLNPLFQVMFDLPADPRPELALPGLEPARVLAPDDTHTGTCKIDLALFLWDAPDGMTAAFEYNTDLFDETTVRRMLAHYEVLLRGIAADPDARIATLPILPRDERQKILVDWNDTRSELLLSRCVHELVEEQARLAPDALAVAGGGTQLDYATFNRRANQLAHRLRKLGVGPDVLVAVCMERTVEMVTALLAVLKAGGAYVPLDPGNPAERQAMMLEDAAVPVLLTQPSLRDKMPATDAHVLALEPDWQLVADESDADPEVLTGIDDLAYVIFTSGSTGRPKGVQIPHRGLLNLLTWHQHRYRVTAADRATQTAGLAFDASVWELWPYLCAGASIHLPDDETRAVPGALLQWFADQRITLSFCATPLAELMLKEPCPKDMALRSLLTGGDKLHRPPPAGLPFELVNHYGPSENSVVATFTPVPPAAEAAEADLAPPIGKPIANVRIYILDAHGEPVPIGVPGELHVAGESLARGYHGRDDMTRERFVPDPFAGVEGARMYRTGDLARYRTDGHIEFLGRVDHQVKVRGFRIELGEIEAVLRSHDKVRDALVMVREDAPDERRLCAYVIDTGAPDAAELRSWLGEKLPDYMVPAAYHRMDAFPLTRNGKVDRAALPSPTETAAATAEVVRPQNEIERTIATIWSEMLRIPDISVEQSFFDVGGHSLMLLQVRNRLQKELGHEIPVVQLFKHPTIRSLARALGGQPGAQAGTQPGGQPAAAQNDKASPGERGAAARERRDSLRRRRGRLVRATGRKDRGDEGKTGE